MTGWDWFYVVAAIIAVFLVVGGNPKIRGALLRGRGWWWRQSWWTDRPSDDR